MGKKWIGTLLRRRFFIVLLLLAQIFLLGYSLVSGSMTSTVISSALWLVSVLVCLYIIVARKGKDAYKLIWVFLILLFPVFGGLFYLLFNFQTVSRRFPKKINALAEKAAPLFSLPGSAGDAFSAAMPEYATQAQYLENFAGFPVYGDTDVTYFPSGEEKFEALLAELQKAEKYIFLEYFIVEEGTMWNAILNILKQKAKEGVKVRVLYDDLGCVLLLPKDYPKRLRAYGIECAAFNPFLPVLTAKQNNRDHRKIAVIDGKVAFTGGVNLADEYINAIEKYGHWKDAAVCVRGKAAWSFTLLFLQMWEFAAGRTEDYTGYYPYADTSCSVRTDGYVQPYADSPTDVERVGENVYLQMIHGAKRYIYIQTPYLIPDDTMLTALCLAAKSGVDVRIITPYKWDKRLVHMTTRSYYRTLVDAGVKVYEYSKGFVHAKTMVADDVTATVGTTNLDFRSLYLHFECGVRLYGCSAIAEIRDDFLQTLPQCKQIAKADCRNGLFRRILQGILRLFAPLM